MIHFADKPVRAVLFDMDGTMFDTERLRFDTIRQASRELTGTAIADETLMGSLGLSALRAEALAKEHNGPDYPYREIRRRADELELAHIRTHGVPVKPGLPEVLERLRRSGVALAVATSSRRAIAEEYLINANVLKYFDMTVCGDEVSQGKPHPEIFLRAARDLGCDPAECLIMEDSENGLLAAAAAGGLPVFLLDIKEPRADIRATVFRGYDSMTGFLDELRHCTPALPVPALTEPFPTTLNDLTVGIHGFGAIGAGYLAQIFSHWDGYTRPREIIGVTGNAVLRALVNDFGKYTVRYGAFDQTQDHIRLIDSADEAGVCAMYASAAIIGLSLPEGAIRQQAPLIARGLLARYRNAGPDLVILTLVNRVSGADFARRQIAAALQQLAPGEAAAIMARTSFPETVVNRIVSRMNQDKLLRQARIKLRMFEQNAPAPADTPGADTPTTDRLRQAAGMARALDQLNLVLCHAEPDMPVYAGFARGMPHNPGAAQMLGRLRQVSVTDDIHMIQTLKNRLWNGTHAILAWYADLLGHQTIGQGMADARVVALLDRLLEQEVRPALLAHFPKAAEVLPGFTQTFMNRCRASFRDPCRRVGRDPLRKLQRRERIFGNIIMARDHGLPSDTLEFGAALGVHFALRMAAQPDSPPGKDSTPNKECRLIHQIYSRRNSIADVLSYSGPYHGQPYPGLDPAQDAALIARITAHFQALGPASTASTAAPRVILLPPNASRTTDEKADGHTDSQPAPVAPHASLRHATPARGH